MLSFIDEFIHQFIHSFGCCKTIHASARADTILRSPKRLSSNHPSLRHSASPSNILLPSLAFILPVSDSIDVSSMLSSSRKGFCWLGKELITVHLPPQRLSRFRLFSLFLSSHTTIDCAACRGKISGANQILHPSRKPEGLGSGLTDIPVLAPCFNHSMT